MHNPAGAFTGIVVTFTVSADPLPTFQPRIKRLSPHVFIAIQNHISRRFLLTEFTAHAARFRQALTGDPF